MLTAVVLGSQVLGPEVGRGGLLEPVACRFKDEAHLLRIVEARTPTGAVPAEAES